VGGGGKYGQLSPHFCYPVLPLYSLHNIIPTPSPSPLRKEGSKIADDFEGIMVVVAKYVMVDKNLPHDRRDYQVLVWIMRQ